MKTGKTRRAAVAVAAVMSAGLAATAAFAATSEAPTFKQFADSTFRDADGQYVVNGDEPALDRGDLRSIYDKMTKTPKAPKSVEDGLIINKVNGVMDKWSASQALNLTYCVSSKFGGDYNHIPVEAIFQLNFGGLYNFGPLPGSVFYSPGTPAAVDRAGTSSPPLRFATNTSVPSVASLHATPVRPAARIAIHA